MLEERGRAAIRKPQETAQNGTQKRLSSEEYQTVSQTDCSSDPFTEITSRYNR